MDIIALNKIIAKLSEVETDLDRLFNAEVPGDPDLFMALEHVRNAISRLER